jgi:hypothetical protein
MLNGEVRSLALLEPVMLGLDSDTTPEVLTEAPDESVGAERTLVADVDAIARFSVEETLPIQALLPCGEDLRLQER